MQSEQNWLVVYSLVSGFIGFLSSDTFWMLLSKPSSTTPNWWHLLEQVSTSFWYCSLGLSSTKCSPENYHAIKWLKRWWRHIIMFLVSQNLMLGLRYVRSSSQVIASIVTNNSHSCAFLDSCQTPFYYLVFMVNEWYCFMTKSVFGTGVQNCSISENIPCKDESFDSQNQQGNQTFSPSVFNPSSLTQRRGPETKDSASLWPPTLASAEEDNTKNSFKHDKSEDWHPSLSSYLQMCSPAFTHMNVHRHV